MLCPVCNSIKTRIDAEKDLFFCLNCGDVFSVDYAPIPKELYKKYLDSLKED